jgi:hypothetical protein
VRTTVSEMFGIDVPILAFSHCRTPYRDAKNCTPGSDRP